MLLHKLHEPGDGHYCPARGDYPRPCNICDGGLAICSVCRGVEEALPTHCPGQPMPSAALDLVYNGHINFRDCQWRHESAWAIRRSSASTSISAGATRRKLP